LETKPDEDMDEEGLREHRVKWEGFEDATEDTAEADKDGTNKEDTVKQDEALFNREGVPEARTQSPRKSNSQHPKNWRLKLMLLLLQVGVVMKKDNSREIMDAVMLNTEYKAGVKVHQGKKLNRYEKPETREVMLKTNPEGKYDEVNVVRRRGNVRQEQVEQLMKVLGYKRICDL
jgi:hypothetical protein